MTLDIEAVVFGAMDRRLDPASTAPIVVALSGGSDSLALLYLALDWAKRHGRRVLALTVDHGLNSESARWTAEAGEKARGLGAAWGGLAWEGRKPATGIQAKARAARHGLLAVAAREAGARVILMGHTANDIAEGDVMRAADAPGLGRLHEWAPSPVWPAGRGVFLLRPLLGVGRAGLRAHLIAKRANWLDDPANKNERFARVRARNALNIADPCGGGDAGFCSVERATETCAPAALEKSWEEAVPQAAAVVFVGMEAVAPKTVSANVLAALLLSVSGTSKPPRGTELTRLRAVIAAGGVATLCGCRVDARGEAVHIGRTAPRRGQAQRPVEPSAWVEQRFRAACGFYPDEASLPPVIPDAALAIPR